MNTRLKIGILSIIALISGVVSTATAQSSGYRVSAPYTYKNLTIFLIHGKDESKKTNMMTLQEAMERKLFRVYETSEVNELEVENLSKEQDVFIQSGDIVKGGKQDRVLALDMIVPSRSGRIPIDSFCVEHGRWQQRGGEAAAAFGSSDQMLNHKDLKIAAKSAKSQTEVWDKVAESQAKLSKNVAVAASPAAGAGGGFGSGSAGGVAETVNVTSSVSRSSLQLTLENKQVKDTSGEYIKALAAIVAGKNDVIGYAFAINGQINSADVYSSHALFAKLWSKMLKASAIEAIAEFDKSDKVETVTADAIKGFLAEAETGKAEAKQLTPRMTMVKSESEKNLFFETRDRKRGDEWLHRNYLKK